MLIACDQTSIRKALSNSITNFSMSVHRARTSCYNLRGTIAKRNTNYLWRMTEEKAALAKVRILGNDNQVMLPGIVPDFIVLRRVQTNVADVD